LLWKRSLHIWHAVICQLCLTHVATSVSESCDASTSGSCKVDGHENLQAEKLAQGYISTAMEARQRGDQHTCLLYLDKVETITGVSSSQRSTALINAGIVLKNLGRLAEGVSRLRLAVELDPTSFYAQHGLASLLSEAREFVAADLRFAASVPLMPREFVVPVRINYGTCLWKAFLDGTDGFEGRDLLQEAKEHFKVALKQPQPPFDAVTKLVSIYHILGKHKAKDTLLKRATKKGMIRDVRQYPRRLKPDLAIPKSPFWNEHGRLPFLTRAANEWQSLLNEFEVVNSAGNLGTVGERVKEDAELYNKFQGGRWQELAVFHAGVEVKGALEDAPEATKLFRNEQTLVGCELCQVAYSLLWPGTKLYPHCGSSNEILTCHLGLRIPAGDVDKVGISVGGEKRQWSEGQWLCFEDSMEHFAWNMGDNTRLILIVQVRHPLLR